MSAPPILEALLVEDNPQDAELITRALQRHDLADGLIHVQDGAEALDFLFGRGRYEGRSGHTVPGVILLDLKLPRISGLEVLAYMKTHKPVQFDTFIELMSRIGMYGLQVNCPPG